jgi:CDP-diacylglycerol--glycerol-3-phosphate 3-phosphatidyltransferase
VHLFRIESTFSYRKKVILESVTVVKRITFTDRLRAWFKWLLDPLAKFFNHLGIHPNVMTLLGLLGTVLGATLVARGQMTWGGLVILFTVPIDALDGTMARQRGEATDWGAFVDSVSDRYSELAIFFGLLIYYLNLHNQSACVLVFLAASGTVLVSYSKARADSLKLDANVGLLTRAERYLVLAPALVLQIPIIAIWIIAILANFTALQRIIHVRQDTIRQKSSKEE